jgi:hypothetical protein
VARYGTRGAPLSGPEAFELRLTAYMAVNLVYDEWAMIFARFARLR